MTASSRNPLSRPKRPCIVLATAVPDHTLCEGTRRTPAGQYDRAKTLEPNQPSRLRTAQQRTRAPTRTLANQPSRVGRAIPGGRRSFALAPVAVRWAPENRVQVPKTRMWIDGQHLCARITALRHGRAVYGDCGGSPRRCTRCGTMAACIRTSRSCTAWCVCSVATDNASTDIWVTNISARTHAFPKNDLT